MLGIGPHSSFDYFLQFLYYTVSQKRCHPNRGYNFVNSLSIYKLFSLLQTAVNFQRNQY